MDRRRAVRMTALFFAVLGGGIIVLYIALYNVMSVTAQNSMLYKHVVRIKDVERRQERLGSESDDKLVDLTAFAGMPDRYSEVVSEYVESVSSAIKAGRIMRRRFYHNEDRPETKRVNEYPDVANPVYDRDVVVPLVVLPRPDAVRRWSVSSAARSLGWRVEDKAIESRGTAYGRTLIFQPGTLSTSPRVDPASPFEAGMPNVEYWGEHAGSYYLELGKLVVAPAFDPYNRSPAPDRLADLHLGEEGGAVLLGELITVPIHFKNHRLRWVSIQNGSNVRRFLAYSILDGNGVKRARRFQQTADGPISSYIRPLICDRHQPKIKQHDELLLPSPMAWPPTQWEKRVDPSPHEEWCLDDWFPAQKDACWVIREAEDSKPLQESFLLMSASEESDRPAFLIALFAETEPKQLVKELAALYKVSADTALNSPETMERLNSLYEKVRDFPLAR